MTDRRAWMIEVFRQANVFGHHQDAERRLRVAGEQARVTLDRRRHFLP